MTRLIEPLDCAAVMDTTGRFGPVEVWLNRRTCAIEQFATLPVVDGRLVEPVKVTIVGVTQGWDEPTLEEMLAAILEECSDERDGRLLGAAVACFVLAVLLMAWLISPWR